MKKRDTPRVMPIKRYPYLIIRSPELGDVWLCCPSFLQTGSLISLAAEQTETEGIIKATAALIGAAWYHESMDLEALHVVPPVQEKPSAEQRRMLEYGAAVYEELHKAGWQAAHLSQVWHILVEAIRGTAVFDTEAATRSAFFALDPETGEPTTSDSGSPTTEAQQPGMA